MTFISISQIEQIAQDSAETVVFQVANIAARDALSTQKEGDFAEVATGAGGGVEWYAWDGVAWLLVSDLARVSADGSIDTHSDVDTSTTPPTDGQVLTWVASEGEWEPVTPAAGYVHPNHTGDVTSVGDGAQTIAANAVDNTKLADAPANTLKGNNTGVAADPIDLTVAQVQTLLNVEDGAAADQSATEVPYSPTSPGDWPDPDPVEVGGALDDAASRIQALEGDQHVAVTLGGVANDTTDDTLDLVGQVLTVNLAVAGVSDGAISAADQSKLDGIASGATVGVQTEDEGVLVDADATVLNFVGAGVTATDAGAGQTDITIPGGSGLATKSGKLLPGAFTGNPKVGTVTFSTAFPDANYSIAFGVESSSNTTWSPAVVDSSKAATGFDVQMGSNSISNLTCLNWIAVAHGES